MRTMLESENPRADDLYAREFPDSGDGAHPRINPVYHGIMNEICDIQFRSTLYRYLSLAFFKTVEY